MLSKSIFICVRISKEENHLEDLSQTRVEFVYVTILCYSSTANATEIKFSIRRILEEKQTFPWKLLAHVIIKPTLLWLRNEDKVWLTSLSNNPLFSYYLSQQPLRLLCVQCHLVLELISILVPCAGRQKTFLRSTFSRLKLANS